MQSISIHNMGMSSSLKENDLQLVLEVAVPFKWEVSPGVPASLASSTSSHTSPASVDSSAPASLTKKLVLPPRPVHLFGKSQPLSSPQSPRSTSLSKRMRALLQGKTSLSRKAVIAEDYSSSSSSAPVSPSSCSSSCSSDGEHQTSLKSVSTMLVGLWYKELGYGESSQHLLSWNEQAEIPTPGSSFNSSSTESPTAGSSFNSSASDFDCFEPVEAEATVVVGPKSVEDMSNGLKLLLKSDRFRVEHSGSPSLLESRDTAEKPIRRLQSALKSSVKNNSTTATIKKVRFADEQQQHSGENSSNSDASCSSALLSRDLSRRSEWLPAPSQALSTEDDKENKNVSMSNNGNQQVEYLEGTEEKTTTAASRPSRARRDLSELVMQIIQADAADLAAKQKSRNKIKSMFFKSSSSTNRWS